MTHIDRRTALLSVVTAGIGIPLALAALPALAQTAPAAGGDQSDYVQQTLALGTVAMRSSEIAAQKATHPMVMEFATLEVAEQKTIASILSATEAGKTPPEIPPEEQGKIDEMNGMEAGAEFDMAYVDAQIEGHTRLLEVQKSLSGETEATVEAITARMAEQAVTSHLAMLNHIREALNAGGAAPSAGSTDQSATSNEAPADANAAAPADANAAAPADANAAAPAETPAAPAN